MLYGRAAELDAVDRLLGEVLAGRQRTLVVEGEAGIGKTRLLAEAVARAHARRFSSLTGAAEPAERGRPFGAIAHVLGLAGGMSEAARLLAELERANRDARWADPVVDAGFRVTDLVTELFEQAAASGPLLIALDDLHWADRPSTRALAAAHRRLAGLPVALLVTLRGGAVPAYVDELLDRLADGSTHVTLPALTDAAITELAGELAGGTPGAVLRRQLGTVGGNPFFATELVRALRDEGLLAVHDGVADTPSTSIPSGLVHTVLRRLRLLPEETVDLLQLASILGQTFSVRDLALLAQRSAVDVARLLSPALRAHTLREAGDQLAFGHALTWEAVYHDLPMAARRAVHRQAATLLAGAGVPPVRVAQHFVLGADAGDHEAVSWLRQAARSAAPGSPAVAAELLGNALDLAGDDHPERDSITAELAPLLVVTGSVARAAALTSQALARRLDPRIEVKLRVGLTHVLMRCGRVDDAREQVSGLLELLPAEARELTMGVASYVQLASGDVERADAMARRALAAAEHADNDVVIATALMTLTWTHAALGRVDDAIAAGRRAVAVTEASRAPFSGFLFPHAPLGAALLQADRLDEAERAFADGLARADRTAAPGTVVYHHVGIAAAKFLTGEWDDALSEAEVALELAEPTGTSWALLPSAVIARVAVARGDLDGAADALTKAFRAPEASHRTMTMDWLHWARAVYQAATGELDGAVATAERAWHGMPAHDLIGSRLIPIDWVRLALAGGQPSLAKEVAAEVAVVAERAPVRSLRAAALHCQGLVDGSADALLAAVELLRATPAPSLRRYQLAMACEDAAAAADDPGALFHEALAQYRKLDAHHDLARVSAAMRARGLRSTTGQRRTGRSTELTRTERKVATLVAEGLSNPQIAQRLFISRHTAETHMKHIFTKLRISSRAELAAMVAKQSR